MPLSDALAFLPEVRLEGEDARKAAHGVAVPGDRGWLCAAHRRARPDRHRRAPRGRDAQARRRLPRLMNGLTITWLPDARPRERHLAVGEFDGVHIGHREVIHGADTVLTFEPHPRFVVAPDSAPKLLTPLAVKADLIAELAVRELVVIPFDGSFAAPERAGVHRPGADRARSARARSRSGRTSASATRPRATRRCCAPRTAFEHARRRARRARRRDRLLHAHPRARHRRRGRRRRTASSAPRSRCAAIVAHGDKRGRRSASRPPTSCPTARSSSPATASTPAAREIGGQRHLAAVNVGVRPTFQTGRGLLVEAYLLDFSRRPLRPGAAAGVPGPPARREALRFRRRARGADAPRRRRGAPHRRLTL